MNPLLSLHPIWQLLILEIFLKLFNLPLIFCLACTLGIPMTEERRFPSVYAALSFLPTPFIPYSFFIQRKMLGFFKEILLLKLYKRDEFHANLTRLYIFLNCWLYLLGLLLIILNQCL